MPEPTFNSNPVEDSDRASDLEQPRLGFTRSDRMFLMTGCLVCLLLFGMNWWSSSLSGRASVEIRHLPETNFVFQLDINTATWVEWMQLEGVGEITARNIVADREDNGPFLSLADLQRVRGIGPATFAKMHPQLICSSCE